MHLIAAIPGGWSPDQQGVVYIDQAPGDIVFLSASDTELAVFSAAFQKLNDEQVSLPSLRLSNLANLKQELTVDTYSEEVLSKAKLIVVRILGGRSYFGYLVCRRCMDCLYDRNTDAAIYKFLYISFL